MRLGLIAGNGRFPFLVLDAARAQGYDVTIVAVKEEAFPTWPTPPRASRGPSCTGCRSGSWARASRC